MIAVSISRGHPYLYLARFLFIYYVIEIIIGLIVVVCDYNYLLPVIHSASIPVREILPKWSVVVLVAGLCINMGLYVASPIRSHCEHLMFINRCNVVSKGFPIQRIANIFALIFTLSILFPFVPQFPYALRIITLSFDFLPLFVGLYYSQLNRGGKTLWLVLLFINMAANIIQASRGLAVIPIALFLMGYLVSVSNKPSLKKRIIVISLASIPFLSLFGKIQDFREEFGRGNTVTIENANLLLNYLKKDTDSSKESLRKSVSDGLGRFINVGDFAIVYMTPSQIPHRGFVQMEDEIKSIVTLYGAEGSAKFRETRGDLKYGSGVLSAYGFSVNETTSVGMGLLGDAYSRFGFWGVAVYLFLMTFIISKMELYIISKFHSIFGIILFLFLAYTFLYTIYGNSYFAFFKKIIFNGMLVFFVSKLITLNNIAKI